MTPRFIIYCSVLLLSCTGLAFGAGEYQKTKDEKTTVWNNNPKPGDTATWFGERDKEGYATGMGTITWYTGSGALYARYYGNMVRGKLDGAVNVHTKGKIAHAYFTDGMRTSQWVGGPAMSRRVPPEFTSPEKRQASKPVEKSREEPAAERPKASPSPVATVEQSPPPPPVEKTPEPPKVASTPPGESVQEESPAEVPTPAEVALPPSPTPPPPTPTSTPTPKPKATPTPKPVKVVAESKPKPTKAPVKPSPSPAATKTAGVDDSLRMLMGPPSSLRSSSSEGASPAPEDQPATSTPAEPEPAAAKQLSKEDVILISDAKAKNIGVDLHDYHRPKVEYDDNTNKWSVVYDKKAGDAATGAPSHLNVTVDDKTKEAEFASP